MLYRLDAIASICDEHGLKFHRPDEARIDVLLRPDCTLSFLNLDGEDSLVGFDGTPWHSHDIVQFCTVPSEYIECDELDLLIGLLCGDLLVVSQYRAEKLHDRWLCHKLEAMELNYMDAGERIEVWRFPSSPPGGA